jgi:hypothetical protein
VSTVRSSKRAAPRSHEAHEGRTKAGGGRCHGTSRTQGQGRGRPDQPSVRPFVIFVTSCCSPLEQLTHVPPEEWHPSKIGEASYPVAVAVRRDPIPRHLEPRVTEALSDTRIVVIQGARQVGKRGDDLPPGQHQLTQSAQRVANWRSAGIRHRYPIPAGGVGQALVVGDQRREIGADGTSSGEVDRIQGAQLRRP